MSDYTELLLRAIRHRWSTPSGLVLVLLLVGVTLAAFFAQFDLTAVSRREWLFVGVVLAVVALGWWRTRLPRVGKHKVGFGVAIHFEDPNNAKQLKADLVDTMAQLLQGSRLRYDFQFIEFSQAVARRVVEHPEDVDRLVRQANLKFLMWGRARVRTLTQGAGYVIDLRGLVAHGGISAQQADAFGKEFSAVLPGRLIIGPQGNMFACEFAARQLDAAARYVIGTAAALSNDFTYAEQLLLNAETTVSRDVQRAAGAPVSVLLDRIRRRIAELYSEWLNRLMRQFVATRNRGLLEEADAIVGKLRRYQPDSYEVRLCAAQIAFVLRRDLRTARAEIDACRGSNDASWRFSDAFLLAYDGDLQSAYRAYPGAFESQLGDPSIPTQCEEFILTVLDEEPERHWLHFCLGLINYRAKADLASARRDFQRFLQHEEPTRFARQIAAVERWLEEIETVLPA
jgi:hypothetical protein